MYGLLVLALPYLVKAGQHEVWQKPMMETGDIKIPLTITDNNEFFFPSLDSPNNLTRLELEALQTIINDGAMNSRTQGITINIPLDPKQPGSLSLDQTMGQSLEYFLEPESEHVWTETQGPGKDIWIEYVGLRRGGMILMDAYIARLAPETPYITLPSEIYDVVALSSKPERVVTSTGFEDVVDCERVPTFLDIILGLLPEEEDEELTEEGEVVIKPEQYVMKVDQGELEGKCILLARRAEQEGTEEVVLGWAAMRGREVVLDWGNALTGMGR